MLPGAHISGKEVLVISQIAFYDDTGRLTAKVTKLAEELEGRVRQEFLKVQIQIVKEVGKDD